MSESTKLKKKEVNWERVGRVALSISIQVGIAFLSGIAMAAGQSTVQRLGAGSVTPIHPLRSAKTA